MEPAAIEPWRSVHPANDADDGFANNLDRFWIDLGGEG
jgi:hypothetical protein